jgi:hypothetical protein
MDWYDVRWRLSDAWTGRPRTNACNERVRALDPLSAVNEVKRRVRPMLRSQTLFIDIEDVSRFRSH